MTFDRPRRGAMLAAAVALAACGAAHGAVVCTSAANLNVPATGEGLYLNFITGVSGQAESQVPGFDLDIYAQQVSNPAGQMRFYWGSASNGGAGVVTSGDTYAVLAPGDIVDGTRIFSRAGAAGITAVWQAGITGILGVRFKNEGTGVINYGWVRVATTAPLGFPATYVEWCYEDTGSAITVVPPDALFWDGFDPAQ